MNQERFLKLGDAYLIDIEVIDFIWRSNSTLYIYMNGWENPITANCDSETSAKIWLDTIKQNGNEYYSQSSYKFDWWLIIAGLLGVIVGHSLFELAKHIF